MPHLPDLLREVGLPFEESDDALVVRLRGRRRRHVDVEARELPGGIASFVVPLAEPPRSGADDLPLRLLRATGTPYAKGVVLESGALALAAEVPLATLTPDLIAGIIGATAALADLRSRDLRREERWADARSRAVDSLLARFSLDVEQCCREMASNLRAAGHPVEEREGGSLSTTLEFAGESRLVFVSIDRQAISLVTYPDWLRIGPAQYRTQRRLLELNHSVTVAKVGVDARYEAVLSYQVPATFSGLQEHAVQCLGALVSAVDEAGTELWGT